MADSGDDGGRTSEDREIERLQERCRRLASDLSEAKRLTASWKQSYTRECDKNDALHGRLNEWDAERRRLAEANDALTGDLALQVSLVSHWQDSHRNVCESHKRLEQEVVDLHAENKRLLNEIGGYMRANDELQRRVCDHADRCRSLETIIELGSTMIDAQSDIIEMLRGALEDDVQGPAADRLSQLSESLGRLGGAIIDLPTQAFGPHPRRSS
jgi:chromosome segregation ATPase